MSVNAAKEAMIRATYQAQTQAAGAGEAKDKANAKKFEEKKEAIEAQHDGAGEQHTKDTANGVAQNVSAGLGVAAAICACFWPVGTLIGGILAAVAIAITAVTALVTHENHDEDIADFEKQSNEANLHYEKLNLLAEDAGTKKAEQRDRVRQNMQFALQVQQEQNDAHKKMI